MSVFHPRAGEFGQTYRAIASSNYAPMDLRVGRRVTAIPTATRSKLF